MSVRDTLLRAAGVLLAFLAVVGGVFVVGGLLSGWSLEDDSLFEVRPGFAWAIIGLFAFCSLVFVFTFGAQGFRRGRNWTLALCGGAIAGIAVTYFGASGLTGSGPGLLQTEFGWILCLLAWGLLAMLPTPRRKVSTPLDVTDGSPLDF